MTYLTWCSEYKECIVRSQIDYGAACDIKIMEYK